MLTGRNERRLWRLLAGTDEFHSFDLTSLKVSKPMDKLTFHAQW